MIAGRPLRFLVLVAGGWVAARGVMLWPGLPPIGRAGRAIAPRAEAAGHEAGAAVMPAPAPAMDMPAHRRPALAVSSPLPAPDVGDQQGPEIARSYIPPPPPPSPPTQAIPAGGIIAGLPVPLSRGAANARAVPTSRFSGSAWFFIRPGNGPTSGLSGPQLGGSQAGARLAYALTADRRLALAARASSPLGKGMREVALGLEWQPTRLPVRVIAEQRIAVGGGRGGPTLSLVGGAGPLPVLGGFRLETYAQAGIIGRDGGEGFADGAARIARPLVTVGGVRIDLGGGLWGAAQKGASRVDTGPSLSARVPLGSQPVRVSLDWRQRVAGNATPGSGLVLTLGADF